MKQSDGVDAPPPRAHHLLVATTPKKKPALRLPSMWSPERPPDEVLRILREREQNDAPSIPWAEVKAKYLGTPKRKPKRRR